MTDFILLGQPAISWMVIGAVLIAAEVMLMPGIGLLFAGLAAILVGGGISLGYIAIDNMIIQIAWFFAFTGLWALLLWIPLKRLTITKKTSYSNIIGQTALLTGKPLQGKDTSQIKWSGTIMNARLSPNYESSTIDPGKEVEIVRVEGTTVFVKPISN